MGRLPETKYVTGTNYLDIGLAVDKRLNKLIVFLPWIWQGAASQAIQSLNIMAGFEETKGLLSLTIYLIKAKVEFV